MFRASFILAACLAAVPPAFAQTGGTSTWFQRSDRAKAEQPHWITPLATTTPRLEQEFRYDIVWQQPQSNAPYVRNLGNGKGLELIPFDRVEVIAGVPPYVAHGNAGIQDGFGDFRLLIKYRLLAADEERGNYIVTAFADVSFPTGSAGNGSTNTIVTPTLAYGKGFGPFDVQGTFGVALPTGNEAQIGRTYTWNNAFQYHVFRTLWPEVEVNAAWFEDGRNAGSHQVFVTPGLVAGRFPLTGRVALTIGFGVQIPVSEFHTSEHNFILSVRFPF